MVERRRSLLQQLSVGRTIQLVLLSLTVALAVIAAVGIGDLYDARQRYEDTLGRTYELEAAGSRLLAAGVIEEATLRERGATAADARRRAAEAFDAEAARALQLVRADRASQRLLRARIALERRTRRLAARSGRRSRRLASAILAARGASEALAARQRERRGEARERARDESRTALFTVLAAGGLALVGALLMVGALIASIRRPLEDLVGATRLLALGHLSERVDPAGPAELRALGSAFNSMADQLQGAQRRLGEEQRRVEEEREKLSATIESLGDALVVCDSDGVVTAVNRRAVEVVPTLRPGTRASAAGSPLPALEESLRGEVMREQGERTLAITAARLGERGDGGVVWTLRDVSERARLERLKSDFVATASHELRSPLTSIKGFVELLGRSRNVGGREREFVDVILQSTDRLVDLVNDLLDVTRLEAGRMEVHPRLFDLGQVVREVVKLMQPRLADKGQRLELHVPPELPRTLADPLRVRQIVVNLLSNAHQYTDEGGRLSVAVRPRAGGIELAVSDTGRGMTREELDQVFDRFVRRGDGVPGTGLGLWIVKSLVDLQRGSIEVESEPGAGSTFTVRLPAEAQPGRARAPRDAIRGKRVLVVDDEPGAAEAIAEQLRAFDVQTAVARGGEEAIERMRADGFDAMTLDILMPGRSGLEVLRALRTDAALRRTPVVVVSVFSAGEALFGEWKVTKPVEPEELADVLGSAMLAGRTRVLVVGRSAVRPRLEPALQRLGLDHEWVTSAAAAAKACAERRYEIALVDAGLRSPQAVLRALDLRGRRRGKAMVVFSTGEDAPGAANLGSEPVPIEDAAAAVLELLAREIEAGSLAPAG